MNQRSPVVAKTEKTPEFPAVGLSGRAWGPTRL